MSILLYIPIAQFIVSGIFMKIYRGEEPDFSNAGKSFIQGLLMFIAEFVYTLIPVLIIILSALFSASESLSVITLIGLVVVGIVLAFIIGFILIPVQVNFARRQSFGAAFAFGEIFGMIGKLGLAKYILAWIVYFIVAVVFAIVIGIFSVIPVIGAILLLLFGPFIGIFAAQYFNNLFEQSSNIFFSKKRIIQKALLRSFRKTLPLLCMGFYNLDR
ncbi:MAG: DUF4013 domain-containing protein [Methanocorpusculum sp.]|nr:DUF4013 domain-containing protein [Methanocorpusculum sp.]